MGMLYPRSSLSHTLPPLPPQVEGAGGASTADGASNGQVKPEPGAAEAPLALAGQLAVKTEVGAASPLAVPGQQPQPLPNVGQTPAAAAATSGGAPGPNGAAGGGAVVPGGGAVVPGGGGPPVAGAPGAAGSSSQGRKSTLPVQALVHAFHCTDPACQQKTCADTKQVLKRMEVHVQQCPTRRAQQSAQQGGPPPQQAECKVCKLWQALLCTPAAPPPPTTTEAVAPAEAVEVGEASAAPPAAPPPPTPNEAEAEAEAEEDTFGGFLREEYTFGGYEGGFPRP